MTGGGDGDPGTLRVAVVNCTPDNNKGASAISWGLVNRLKKSGLVGQVTLVASEGAPGDVAYRHSLERFEGEVPILPAPVPTRSRERREYSARNAAPLVTRTIGMQLRSYRKSLRGREDTAEALGSADVVFNRGGPFFSVTRGRVHVGLRLAWPLLFASKEGVPYALVGEGVGPFVNPLAKRFHRRLFERASFIAVRNELSRDCLRGLGVPDDRIHITLDNAFWIEPRSTARVEGLIESLGLVDGRFLAVTVRRWPGAEDFLPELARTIDALVPDVIDQAVLITNTFSPGKPQADDRNLTERLHAHVEHQPQVHLVDEDLTPDELASLYGRSAVTLGTRLHSVILALTGGAPAVAVSYLPKTKGVMGTLGLDDFVMDMSGYRHEQGVALVQRAMTEQGHVPDLLDRLRAQGEDDLRAFLGTLIPAKVG